tara:strand:- start:495 stop:836 length:342 start_codon:yes stop_codon:yes gene_type:complete
MAMTEINFSRDQCPDIRRFQLDADNAKATQVNIPVWAKRVTIRPESTNGVRIAFTSDSDDIHSDFIKLSGNSPSELSWEDGFKVANGISKLYVANLSSYASAISVSVLVEGAE